jgi:hypothetical protein
VRLGTSVSGKTNSVRAPIGSSLSEQLKYLDDKMKHWEIAKLIHEFTGPNEANWSRLCKEGLWADFSGALMSKVLELLSREDLQSADGSHKLFQPLSSIQAMGLFAIYLNNGPLSLSCVQSAASSGRGGSKWNNTTTHLLRLMQVLHQIAKTFGESHQVLPIETIETRIMTLIGGLTTIAVDNPDSWSGTINEATKRSCRDLSLAILEIFSKLKRIQMTACEESLCKEERSKEVERCGAEWNQRKNQIIRRGIEFLDDPIRDMDYLDMSAIPSPYELFSPLQNPSLSI